MSLLKFQCKLVREAGKGERLFQPVVELYYAAPLPDGIRHSMEARAGSFPAIRTWPQILVWGAGVGEEGSDAGLPRYSSANRLNVNPAGLILLSMESRSRSYSSANGNIGAKRFLHAGGHGSSGGVHADGCDESATG